MPSPKVVHLFSGIKSQKKAKPVTVAALDIGTSKIACFIAKQSFGGEMVVAGIGHQLSKGIRAGTITDVAEAETSIIAAVHSAEQMAGETIEEVVVNLSGQSILSRNVTVELTVSGEEQGGVSEQDIADIIHEGQASVRNDESSIIHCVPVSYFLDEAKGIRDPRQMMGSKLGADLHLITYSTGMIKNLANTIAHCHLNIQELCIAPHAAALGCLEQDEMELGVTLVDMGGGSTGIAIFHGGKNIYSDTVPVGGIHVTNDIAKGLSTSLAHAERLKTLHGSCIPMSQDETVMIDVPQLGEDDGADDGNQMPRSMLVNVIRPRIEELFEMIRAKIEASGVDHLAGRKVVITGGASQLIGVREVANRALSKQIRLAKPKHYAGLADAVSGPAFSTTLGLLEFATKKSMEDKLVSSVSSRAGLSARWDRMVNWVKENF